MDEQVDVGYLLQLVEERQWEEVVESVESGGYGIGGSVRGRVEQSLVLELDMFHL